MRGVTKTRDGTSWDILKSGTGQRLVLSLLFPASCLPNSTIIVKEDSKFTYSHYKTSCSLAVVPQGAHWRMNRYETNLAVAALDPPCIWKLRYTKLALPSLSALCSVFVSSGERVSLSSCQCKCCCMCNCKQTTVIRARLHLHIYKFHFSDSKGLGYEHSTIFFHFSLEKFALNTYHSVPSRILATWDEVGTSSPVPDFSNTHFACIPLTRQKEVKLDTGL